MECELHAILRQATPHQPPNEHVRAAQDDLIRLQHPRLTFHIWDDTTDPRNCDEYDVIKIHRNLCNMLESNVELYTYCSDACNRLLQSYIFCPYLTGTDLSWDSPPMCVEDIKLHLLKVVGTEVARYLGFSNSQVLRSIEECDDLLHSRQPNVDAATFVHWKFLLSRVDQIDDTALYSLLCAILVGEFFKDDLIDAEFDGRMHEIRSGALHATRRMRSVPGFHLRDHIPISPHRNREDHFRHVGNGRQHHTETWSS
jgi:hypothetical protein